MKLKDFFYFNRSDRSVLLFFLLLGIIALALIFFVGGQETATVATQKDTVFVQKQPISSYNEPSYEPYFQTETRQKQLFPFDPNTADSTQLLLLGLQPWQVRNVYKYRAAGGVYRRASDFARLYGLTQKQYRELEPYIRISSDYAPAAGLFPKASQTLRDTTYSYPHKLKKGESIDVNTADTSLLQRVPGIGSYYARRIVVYREKLGGFHSVRQLLEIEDIPEAALNYLTASNNIRRIAVNQLKLNELKRHPYINYYQAKAIVDYRRLRGPLTSLADLRLIKDFTQQDIERLSPYVEF